jgi:hypothetical protein
VASPDSTARRPPRAEGWIAAAGPLASFAVAGAGIVGWFTLRELGFAGAIASMIGWIGFVNLLLAVFNLLPGAPLDGGRIVKAVRWRMHGNRYRATRDAGRAGTYLGWGLAGLGLWLIATGRPGIWLLLTGVFIAVNAKGEILASYVTERLDGVKVRDLTWFGLAEAGDDMDADSMLWDRQRLGHAGAVVVQGADGQPGGLVLEDQLWAIPADQRPWVMLTQLMIPFNWLARAEPDEELSNVLPRLNPARPVVTVWDDGRLLGVVPPKRLDEQLRRRSRTGLSPALPGRQASRTDQSRLATGGLSLHGKLIHRSVRARRSRTSRPSGTSRTTRRCGPRRPCPRRTAPRSSGCVRCRRRRRR